MPKKQDQRRRKEQENTVSQRLHEVAEGAHLSWPTDDTVGADKGDEHLDLEVMAVLTRNQQNHQEFFL
jgi:hypothetical protein